MGRKAGIAALLIAASCGAPPAPDPWTLWTIDTLAARGDPAIAPAGATLPLLSSPYAAGSARQQGGNAGLTIFPAFSEGQTAAYFTTEVWQNFDAIWVQPLYVPLVPGQKPIFGVDATTRFYSPFWQVFFFTPPPGAEFKSAKEVLDSGVALTPGPGKFCAITRDPTLGAAVAEGADHPVRPLSGEPVIYDPATARAPVLNQPAYVDGELVWYIDLGNNRFTWNYETLVVDETPLFTFLRADGTPLDLPKVGGTGPWHHPDCDGHGNCAHVTANKPQFGALWRVWNVLLPQSADVFVPAALPALQQRVKAMGFAAAIPDARVPDPQAYALRVALNGAKCAAGSEPCQWLDSQNAIESLLPDWRATETGTDVSCPLLLFDGKAIGP